MNESHYKCSQANPATKSVESPASPSWPVDKHEKDQKNIAVIPKHIQMYVNTDKDYCQQIQQSTNVQNSAEVVSVLVYEMVHLSIRLIDTNTCISLYICHG